MKLFLGSQECRSMGLGKWGAAESSISQGQGRRWKGEGTDVRYMLLQDLQGCSGEGKENWEELPLPLKGLSKR